MTAAEEKNVVEKAPEQAEIWAEPLSLIEGAWKIRLVPTFLLFPRIIYCACMHVHGIQQYKQIHKKNNSHSEIYCIQFKTEYGKKNHDCN